MDWLDEAVADRDEGPTWAQAEAARETVASMLRNADVDAITRVGRRGGGFGVTVTAASHPPAGLVPQQVDGVAVEIDVEGVAPTLAAPPYRHGQNVCRDERDPGGPIIRPKGWRPR